MSILINKNTGVLVLGITGKEGTFHTERMIKYGTKVVAGVTPGKGGIKHCGVPVYDSVSEAANNHNIAACTVFVPAPYAPGAVEEAIMAGIKLIIVVTEGISPHAAMRFISLARQKGITVLGPNTPGVVTPEESTVGVLSTDYLKKGKIGVISRSGTLTVEICYYLQKEGLGQSTVVGIGGDPVIGSTFRDIYEMFENDPVTEGVVIVGEVGGTMEEEVAGYILSSNKKKPTVAFIAGRAAPRGKRMGHAGAIIESGTGTPESKIAAFNKAKIPLAEMPWDVGKFLKTM